MLAIFQKWLFLCMVLSFCISCSVSYVLQTREAQQAALNLLENSTADAGKYIALNSANRRSLQHMSEMVALVKAKAFATLLENNPKLLVGGNALLPGLLEQVDADQLHVINAKGVIISSTEPAMRGKKLETAPQTAVFLPAITDKNFALALQPYHGGDEGPSLFYTGIARRDAPGVAIIGYTTTRMERTQRLMDISMLVPMYHIGIDGFLAIVKDGTVLNSARPEVIPAGQKLTAILPTAAQEKQQLFTIFLHGTDYVGIVRSSGEYALLALLPAEHVYESRNSSVAYVALANMLLFTAVFWLVSLLLKRLVIHGVSTVNASLQCITAGKLETELKVCSSPEFATLSREINIMVASLRRAWVESKARMAAELEFARMVQLSSLPGIFPPFPERNAVDLHALTRPAREVGGDFYDFFWIGEERLAVVVADVSDKGLGAALLMMRAKTLLANLLQQGLSPAAALKRANTQLATDNSQDMFLTVFVGLLEVHGGELTFANAGHTSPLLSQNGEPYAFVPMCKSLVLGALPETCYEDETVTLAAGSRLLLYTDGVTEAADVEDRLFSEGRLASYATKRMRISPVREAVEDLLQEVQCFAGPVEQNDDITMLLLEYCGRKLDEVLLPASLDTLPQALSFVQTRLERAEADEKATTHVLLSVEELFVNIANHAYTGYTDSSRNWVSVRAGLRMHPRRMVVQLLDMGKSFDPVNAPKPDITLPDYARQEGGLGIHMALSFLDRVEYVRRNGANVLTMSKLLQGISK